MYTLYGKVQINTPPVHSRGLVQVSHSAPYPLREILDLVMVFGCVCWFFN
jgi:hypothetical protein